MVEKRFPTNLVELLMKPLVQLASYVCRPQHIVKSDATTTTTTTLQQQHRNCCQHIVRWKFDTGGSQLAQLQPQLEPEKQTKKCSIHFCAATTLIWPWNWADKSTAVACAVSASAVAILNYVNFSCGSQKCPTTTTTTIWHFITTIFIAVHSAACRSDVRSSLGFN